MFFNQTTSETSTLATLTLAAAAALGANQAAGAQTIALDVDFSDVRTTSAGAPRDFDFGLDLLHGIRVRAHLVGVEPDWNDWIWLRPGAVPTPSGENHGWIDSHAGGYHETAGYSVHAYLTEEGEFAFNFQGFESAQIEGFEIDLGWRLCFDRTAPDPGTMGSGAGRDITLDDTARPGYAQSGDLDLSVTYRDPLRITGEIVHGDIFESLYIAVVDDTFQSTDAFGIVTDLDPRFDDPGDRYDQDAAFEWDGGSWVPMYTSTPEVADNGALVMCAGDAASLSLPDAICYFEMEIHDDWGCGSFDETIENSWYIQASGESGVPMGFTFDSSSGEPFCTRFFDLVGPASFSRFGSDADWYLAITDSNADTLEIDLPDDWYLRGTPSFLLDGAFKSAGMGIKEDGDSLVLMNIDFEWAAFLEYTDLDGDWFGLADTTGVELRVRDLEHDAALAAMGPLHEGIVGVGRGCTGFGDVDITECSATPALREDLDGDGRVNATDLAAILVAWGDCEGCPADLTGDGKVDGGDFALILSAWTG